MSEADKVFSPPDALPIYPDIEQSPVFLRTQWNYDTNAASDATGLNCKDDTMAQQQYKEESDINTIVRRFGLTGEIPGDFQMPQNLDIVDAITDYHTAMNTITEAREEFMRMPPELRARFENDPQRLINFLENPGNRDEAVKLGLLNAPEQPPSTVISSSTTVQPED